MSSRFGEMEINGFQDLKYQNPSNSPNNDYLRVYAKSDGKLYTKDSTGTERVVLVDNGVSGFGSIPTGAILQYGSDTPPNGFMICNGTAISRTTYFELFSAIGTTFGIGDGSTTFNLPDLRGKIAVGKNSADTEFDTVGKSGGAKTHTLTTAEIPAHTHNLPNQKSHKSGGANGTNDNYWGPSTPQANITYSTGGGASHNNIQPYLVLNYIIKYTTDELGQDEERFTLIKRIEKDTTGDEVVTLDGNLYDVIKIYVQTANSTTTLGPLNLTFNGDSGANYIRQMLYSTGSTVAGLIQSANNLLFLQYNYGIVGGACFAEHTLFPKVTGCYRGVISSRCYNYGGLTTIYAQEESHFWKNTADNITTFNIAGFTAGSKHIITIFGRKSSL